MSHLFQPGNKVHEKLKTPEMRAMVYKHFCDYLAAGKFVKYWYYEKDGLSLTYQSLLNYMEAYPEEFEPAKREVADCKGFQVWFDIIKSSANGRNTRANTATLQMIMRNKYDWDKPKDESNEKPKEAIQINIVDARNPVQPEAS